MGQQVNFFMYGSDESSFLSAARQRGDLCVLPDISPTEVFEPLRDLPGRDEPRWFHVWLWDRSICKPPVVSWIEKQRHYSIDPSASEVIEFSRPYERDGRLIRGRLWAELTGWRREAPEGTFEKSAEFRRWFNWLIRWIKKHYTRTPEGWYLGPEARAFQQLGGRLVQADFAPVVKIVKH